MVELVLPAGTRSSRVRRRTPIGHDRAAEQEFVGEEDEQRSRQHSPEQRQSKLFADLALAGRIAGVCVTAVIAGFSNRLVAGILDSVIERVDGGGRGVVPDLRLVGGVVYVRLNDTGECFEGLGVGVGAVRTRHICDPDPDGLRDCLVASVVDRVVELRERYRCGVVRDGRLVGRVVGTRVVDAVKLAKGVLDGCRTVSAGHPRDIEGDCPCGHRCLYGFHTYCVFYFETTAKTGRKLWTQKHLRV